MKTLLITLFATFCFNLNAQTQSEMNAQAAQDFTQADKQLNATYQKVLKKFADDKLALKYLRATQKAWLVFRDAEIMAHFPHMNEPLYYGTMLGLDLNTLKKELTEKRTVELQKFLDEKP